MRPEHVSRKPTWPARRPGREASGIESGTPLLQDIFVFRVTGQTRGRVQGQFEATGIVPRFVHGEREAGREIPLELFAAPGSTGANA